jgi:2-keto-myo-inositol isomerase
MISLQRFALNRIACPAFGLEEFFKLTRELGLTKVELRNDLPGGRVTDSLSPSEAAALAARHGIEVLTINAQQKFNVKALAAQVAAELKRLLEVAAVLRCRAVVLCPNNDTADQRDAETRRAETVEALAALGPLFSAAGLLGYVEPLGFAECSLPSAVTAAEAVKRSGQSCYRVLMDTFHHYLGPDTDEVIGTGYDVKNTGLIHASGVESSVAKERIRDEHRVLVGARDRTGCREQILRHIRLGYAGDISLEPFSAEIQRLGRDELAAALKKSLGYLQG